MKKGVTITVRRATAIWPSFARRICIRSSCCRRRSKTAGGAVVVDAEHRPLVISVQFLVERSFSISLSLQTRIAEETMGRGILLWLLGVPSRDHSVVAVLRPLMFRQHCTTRHRPRQRMTGLIFGGAISAKLRYDRPKAKRAGATRAGKTDDLGPGQFGQCAEGAVVALPNSTFPMSASTRHGVRQERPPEYLAMNPNGRVPTR